MLVITPVQGVRANSEIEPPESWVYITMSIANIPTGEVDAGETFAIDITITNEGNTDIDLSQYELTDGGFGLMDKNSIPVLSGTLVVNESKTLNNIACKVPENVMGGQNILVGFALIEKGNMDGAIGGMNCQLTVSQNGGTVNPSNPLNIKENVTGDGTGSIQFGSSEDILDYLFTPADLNSGNQLDVTWVVNNSIIDNIASQDKEIIVNKAGTKKIVLLLDIELWTTVNGASTKQITELPSQLARMVTINIPEEYRMSNRVFTVIRLHDGIADELPDLDNDPNTITISTDKFSYYALVYEDAVVVAENEPLIEERPVAAKTGDIADVRGSFAICILMAGAVAAMVVLKKRTK